MHIRYVSACFDEGDDNISATRVDGVVHWSTVSPLWEYMQ
jgi:hypothetical protein